MAVHQTSESTLKRAQDVKAEDSPDVGLALWSPVLSRAVYGRGNHTAFPVESCCLISSSGDAGRALLGVRGLRCFQVWSRAKHFTFLSLNFIAFEMKALK